VFNTAAACDLLLTGVLNGDKALAGMDAMTNPVPAQLAQALLRWAVRGEPPAAGLLGMPPVARLLPNAQRKLLRVRARTWPPRTPLDAWVGAQLAALFAAEYPAAPPARRRSASAT